MITNDNNFVILLKEQDGHPNSFLERISSEFDNTSIIHVNSRTNLESYKTRPVLDEKYLVIFDSFALLKDNALLLKLNLMTVIVSCPNESSILESQHILNGVGIPSKVAINEFNKADAVNFVMELSNQKIAKTTAELVVSRVGVNANRIRSAMNVLKHVGYTRSNVLKFIDKHTYSSHIDLLYVLLGVSKTKAQLNRAILYLQSNLYSYNPYIRNNLVKECDLIWEIFVAYKDGVLNETTIDTYIESNKVPRWKLLKILDLYSMVSLVRLRQLRQFLETATLLEVVSILGE